jgi:hypothetical protein
VPADRMAVYRQAFQAVLHDPLFRAESTKQRLSIDPLDDKQIAAPIARAYAASKPIMTGRPPCCGNELATSIA